MDVVDLNEPILEQAFSIVNETPDMAETIAKLRDFLGVDHLVYHSSRFGASPSSDPYIRLTYPAAWIKRYLQMGYVDVDPVLREGFRRTLPFCWDEVEVRGAGEFAFMADALAHGVGPHGLSIPVTNKRGHRALVSLSFSRSANEWEAFKRERLGLLVDVANRLHRRVVRDVFGEDQPHLTQREIECLHLTAGGKSAGDIGTILGISAHTVRDHLKSARFKLDCARSTQAVSKAVKLGLMVL